MHGYAQRLSGSGALSPTTRLLSAPVLAKVAKPATATTAILASTATAAILATTTAVLATTASLRRVLDGKRTLGLLVPHGLFAFLHAADHPAVLPALAALMRCAACAAA